VKGPRGASLEHGAGYLGKLLVEVTLGFIAFSEFICSALRHAAVGVRECGD